MFIRALILLFLILEPAVAQEFLSDKDLFDWATKLRAPEVRSVHLATLATVDTNGEPRSRTVAIREFRPDNSILFFTQKNSKKIAQLEAQPRVSVTLLGPGQKHQLIWSGTAMPLSDRENSDYWYSYNQIARLRFLAYGPKTGEPIESNDALDRELADLKKHYGDATPPKPESYVGYRIVPDAIYLYQYNTDRISDAFIATKHDQAWSVQRVVP